MGECKFRGFDNIPGAKMLEKAGKVQKGDQLCFWYVLACMSSPEKLNLKCDNLSLSESSCPIAQMFNKAKGD